MAATTAVVALGLVLGTIARAIVARPEYHGVMERMRWLSAERQEQS